MPKVSIIIPTYNCAKYISNAIKSVLNQTFKEYEVIIVDDGSTDKIRKTIEPYLKQNNIHYIYQENRGPAAARNKGIRESIGDIIAFLDADDSWLPCKLEKSIEFMEKHNFDWICTSIVKENSNRERIIKSIPLNSWVLDNNKEIKLLKRGIFYFSAIPIYTPTIVVQKKCFDKVGLFDESILIGEDTDLWLRFEEAGLRGGYLDKPLAIYRYNPNSITKSKKVNGLQEHCKVAKKHALVLGIQRSEIRISYSNFLWHIADLYFSEKDYLKSIKYIILSGSYNFNLKKMLHSLLKRIKGNKP